MTKDEAIEWLIQIKDKYIYDGDEQFDAKRKEALNMAIEALGERPKGKWRYRIVGDNVKRVCSCCGWEQSYNSPWYMGRHYLYCPHCGADMKGADDGEN